ncbi:uncharacterized protein LOC128680560 isoform X2 [Plodia interpunctella]|uniref:uncharacterized protein LOC128680560 isoform X2 n=1 Tax=Plodia interpunctella TaxID=58824 RepID=UPI0023684A53|nr:uncharacterized protein LOC128680560 isoform X2 [Plodia interpunctella]
MEEEEYDDELPPISVNSSKQDEALFSMPSAEVVASQRARAEECERELQRLRELHERQDSALHAGTGTPATNIAPIAASRSNSSGSEGETALVSAVEALRVSGAAPAPAPAPAAVAVSRLSPRAGALCRAYCAALAAVSGAAADVLTDEIITGIWSWLSGLDPESPGLELEEDGARSLGDDEVLSVGAWLCALLAEPARAVHARAVHARAVHARAVHARARRALHALLAAASDRQVWSLWRALLPALEPRALPALAQALAGQCEVMTAALHRAALTRLLQPREHDEQEICVRALSTLEICSLVSRGWRQVAATERDAALQLLGRALLAARERERQHRDHADELADTLAVLARPRIADRGDSQHADHLKISMLSRLRWRRPN